MRYAKVDAWRIIALGTQPHTHRLTHNHTHSGTERGREKAERVLAMGKKTLHVRLFEYIPSTHGQSRGDLGRFASTRNHAVISNLSVHH